MLESTDFYYNGIYSVDMGIINCKIDSGLFEEPFLAEREIQEISIRGNDRPYFQGVRRAPLTFSLTFAFEDYYDEFKIREVARWLDQDYYRPFYTTSNPERIFYCMLYSDSKLLHNGLREGYVQIQMRCDSPYAYSPQYVSKVYEWDESPLMVNITDFSEGQIDNLVLDDGGLIIDSIKTKWINLSPSLTWKDV